MANSIDSTAIGIEQSNNPLQSRSTSITLEHAAITIVTKTRQHSSRMRTARLPTTCVLVAKTRCQYHGVSYTYMLGIPNPFPGYYPLGIPAPPPAGGGLPTKGWLGRPPPETRDIYPPCEQIDRQKCIPVGCVPSAAVSIEGGIYPGVSAQEGCLPRGVSAWGVSVQGVCLPRGCLLQCMLEYTSPLCEQNDRRL